MISVPFQFLLIHGVGKLKGSEAKLCYSTIGHPLILVWSIDVEFDTQIHEVLTLALIC